MTTAPHIELHPWNTAFEWADHEGPFRRLTETQVEQFDELGYVVDHPDAISRLGGRRRGLLLQYAPDGARVLRGETTAPSTASELANDADRQFPVLVDGQAVAIQLATRSRTT